MPNKPRTRAELINRTVPEAVLDIERQLRGIAEAVTELDNQVKDVSEEMDLTATLADIEDLFRRECDAMENRIINRIRNGS